MPQQPPRRGVVQVAESVQEVGARPRCGRPLPPEEAPEDAAPQDARFSDAEWDKHPFFYYLKRQYQIMAAYLETLADSASEGRGFGWR